MGLQRVVIERDALNVIQRVKALKEDRSVLCSYMHDIQILSKVFEEYAFKKYLDLIKAETEGVMRGTGHMKRQKRGSDRKLLETVQV
ncbi:hypothetical protein J1N35_019452 [Gossypium stocksii]|uniref:RNase H type-1 domain-containing protein n=1 Tax=Gossypium stocksii TaxID=47602 RepID=A0A9D3VSY6_9ROSI|nr:hypothetical protein J1N35_019452 [Gossypium stocksii]